MIRSKLSKSPAKKPVAAAPKVVKLSASETKIHALLVWDEKPTGDGPGGTSDFQGRVKNLGGLIEIINATKLA